MMRNILLIVMTLGWFAGNGQHPEKADAAALRLLDRMSGLIGDMRSCAFRLTTAIDVHDPSVGIVKRFADYQVYLSGPDKMLISAQGYRGHNQYVYNGRQIAFYSFDENNYGILRTPATTIQTIDSLSAAYAMEFPAADFFYPAFTDDLLQSSNRITYLGVTTINNQEYAHIMASGNDADIQLWVSNDVYCLPYKFVITYRSAQTCLQYYASFSDWQVNPDLPAVMFEFVPPPGAVSVKILAKNEK